MSLERARSLPPFVSSVADQQADHHEERPQWQTDSTQEDPEVQSKAGSSSRVLRREIPDSQESFQAEDSGDLEDRLDSHDREVPQSQSLDLLSDNLPHSCRNHQSGRIFGGEIPDSQETQLDNDEEASFHSERTEIIPGGFELRQRGAPEVQDPTTPVWPLHKRGIDCNGRVPAEAPQYCDLDMDFENPTQPQTQPQYDARRLGTSSIYSKQDEADIIAVLHPSSPAAYVAVNLTADASPQHIHQNYHQSAVTDIEEDELEDADFNKAGVRDIALRLSSKVYDIRLGFVFGRNVHKSDILLVKDERKGHRTIQDKNHAISNKHFRIFLNRHGILMLEDTSTNGTIVDKKVLHGPKSLQQDRDQQPQITLHTGVVLELPTVGSGESIRFIVSIPDRYNAQSKYKENLIGYLACIEQAERRAAALAEAEANQRNPPSNVPVLTNALPAGLGHPTVTASSTIIPTLSGNNYGLHWNGGEKYNVIGFLGAGSFATVCKLASKRDGEVFAVKQLEKRRFIRDGSMSRKFHNELNVMMKVNHPNIIRYIEHYETDKHLFIVMDFIPLGDLKAWTDFGKAMTEYMAARVGRQMIEALIYLHDMGITHRDIKPDNILVAGNDPQDKFFKLADFGLSKEIIDDRTFLQTFCGTMLYLAPEVYPSYERVLNGLPPSSKRSRGNQAPFPYKHSVDIWSLGTVIYQLLAGRPPYRATPGDNGDIFLVQIMEIPVDFDRLSYGGISEEAISFLRRMLVIDPRLRSRDTDLINDPWLIPKAYPVVQNNAVGDEAGDLGASQLSLAEDDKDFDEMDHASRAKRYRTGYETNPESPPEWRFSQGPPPPTSPSVLWPGLKAQQEGTAQNVPKERLFGEIGTSALRSSGVLGENANVALGVEMKEDGAEGYGGSSFYEQVPPDLASAGTTHINTPLLHSNSGATQTDIPYPQLPTEYQHQSAGPSLQGAEALIRQLNMASPEPGNSARFNNSKPNSPQITSSREYSLASIATKRATPEDESSAEDDNRKRTKLSNSQALGHMQHRTANSEVHHRSTAAVSLIEVPVNEATAQEEETTSDEPKQTSQNSDTEDHLDGQRNSDRGKSTSMPPTAVNSQDSVPEASSISEEASKKVLVAPPTFLPPPSIYPSIDLAPPSGVTDDGFTKPSMRFGNLVLTKESIKSVRQIQITSLGTTFGRHPSNSYVHPDKSDDHVPKNAFDIRLWYPGMRKDFAAGRDNWATNPNLVALISTRTSRYIKVNGVRLMQGKDCWLYGKLRTGDIISVFERPEGTIVKTDRDRECLRYRCEFFIGASKTFRKDGENFVVEQEREAFMEHQAKKSAQASMSASREGMGSSTAAENTASHTTGGAKETTTSAPNATK